MKGEEHSGGREKGPVQSLRKAEGTEKSRTRSGGQNDMRDGLWSERK